jgi:hypothetical protein
MTNLSTLIDQYAALKAQMGQLEAQKKALEAALAELPAGAYESADYRLTISDSVRSGYDKELSTKLKELTEAYVAGLSRQYLTAHSTETAIRTHRVGLPTGKSLAA